MMVREDDIPVLAPPAAESRHVDLARAIRPIVDRLLSGRGLTVAINDPQRHTDTPAVLNALAELAGPACVGSSPPLQLVVACGTHQVPAAQRQPFELYLRERIHWPVGAILWHDCRQADLTPVSPADRWRVHPALLAGEGPLLAIGSVEPHYFAGLTGAHKTATIGCASFAAIQANHAYALADGSAPLALAGNPVHEGIAGMLAELQSRRPVLAVNLVQTGPAIRAAAAGEPLQTLEELWPDVRAAFCHQLDQPAETLVLDVAGPLARSFYQADKAIKNNENAVRDGGAMILQADCPEGIGQDHFFSLLQQAGTHEQAARLVGQRGYRLGDHKALKLRRLTDPARRGVHVYAVCPGLSPADCAVLGFIRCASLAEALTRAACDGKGGIFRVADAGNSVVFVTQPSAGTTS